MQHPAFGRTAAALILAVAGGVALAQDDSTDHVRMPEPQVMTDTAPLPAQERESIGAVVFEQEPVLAKRAYLQRLARDTSSPDTRSMGASPALFMHRPAPTAEEILRDAQEAHQRRQSQPARK